MPKATSLDKSMERDAVTLVGTATNRRLRALLLGSGDRRPHIIPAVEKLKPEIETLVDVVGVDFEFAGSFMGNEADLAIVFGGDGSILRAAKHMGDQQVPVLGVNFGKLGFLADQLPNQLSDALKNVTRGECEVIQHLMLHCQIERDGKVIADQVGLNELAILGGPPFSMQYIDLYVDSQFATSYSCDGLIISTPIGSTAHNLSAGGPILRKDLQAFVISPISPHTLTVRPIVDTADRTYELVVRKPNESTSAVLDGEQISSLTEKDRVKVCRAKSAFKMIRIHGHDYYQTLREKLGWGGQIGRLD